MPISCDIPQLIGMFFMFYAAQHKKIFGKIVQNTELCKRYPFGSFLLERTTSNFLLEIKTKRPRGGGGVFFFFFFKKKLIKNHTSFSFTQSINT